MTHQNLCLGKYWKLFWVTLIARRASQFIATSLRAAVFPRNVIEMNLSTYLDWKITWTENLLYSNVLADWHSKKNISFEVGKILWNWFYYKRIRKQKKQKEGEKQNIHLTFCAFQSVGKWWTGLFSLQKPPTLLQTKPDHTSTRMKTYSQSRGKKNFGSVDNTPTNCLNL